MIRFRSLVPWLVLLLGAGAAARAEAGFDADSARAKAHRLMPAVVENHAEQLWPEFDAAVAKAQKAAGTVAPTDERLASDRDALIVQLRAEREAHAREAEAALAAADVDLEGAAQSDEIVPGIKDPFKR